MSAPAPHNLLGPNDPTVAWDLLSERIEAFVAAWEGSTSPPCLAEFLPAEPPVLRRLAVAELVKIDLEFRGKSPEQARRLEHYLAEFPELCEGGIPCDLIYEEYHVRKQSGEAVDTQEYFDRFPGQAAELRRLLGLESAHLTTTVRGMSSIGEIDAGQTLDEFDLLTRLGRGAFASVFLARQRSMQRIVALKVSADRGNEPQTMAQLDHPHIVRVFDQRRMLDRKLRLLYMQYVPGGTLQAAIDAIRRLPPSSRNGRRYLEAIDQELLARGETAPGDSRLRQWLAGATWPEVVCWLGARLASALDYAHSRGVLHRDLKPANVLVAADGTPKLADFNISFCSKVEGATAVAYFGGSLAYMSLEQLEACSPGHEREAEDLDARSDIYSLGVLLWELLSSSRPFHDCEPNSDWSGTLKKMATERQAGVSQEAIAQLPSDCPQGVKEILLKCLSPDRADRYDSAGQVARELELALEPQVLRLLHPRPGSWKNWARRFPLTAMFAAALAPNIVASLLNLAYNIPAIFESFGKTVDEVLVDPIIGTINGVAYAVGIGILLPLTWPVVRAVARTHRGGALETDRSPRWRSRCLALGDYTAAISGMEWLISGIVYPAWLSHTVPADQFHTAAVYAHFMASQVLCGLMAGTLAFFCVCLLSVRAYYPTLMQTNADDTAALVQVRRLERRTWVYFALAIAVPPLAVVVMVMVQSLMHQRMPPETFAVLGVVGLANSALAFVLLRAVQRDLAALAVALSPPGIPGAGDSITGSSWRS